MKFGNAFAYFVVSHLLPDGAVIQYKYPNKVYFDCKTKLCLIVPDRQGKYIFTQESFFLQGILMIPMNRTHIFVTVNTST